MVELRLRRRKRYSSYVLDETIDFLAQCRAQVETELERLVPGADVEPVRLHEAIRWSLLAGGKRFRPALMLAVGRTFGTAPQELIRAAAAVEMIHTFSLIHDDLPAMDDDDLRRGRETCHKRYGEATAILAGDALQTLAFKALAEDHRHPAEDRIRVIALLADASGTPAGMVAGQQLDLDGEGRELAIGEIEAIHARKTGALITASAVIGAILGNASNDEISAIELYASRLGLLFQITDDILDVTQTTETIGKTAGKDADARKATYPGHFGLDNAGAMARSVRDDALAALNAIDRDTGILVMLAENILTRTK